MSRDIEQFLTEGWNLGSRFVPGWPTNAPRGVLGSRLGRRPGESLEFVDFRDYEPGDDLRKLDWGAYARSDSLVVRVFREEVTPHLDLIVDASASMGVRPDKLRGTLLAVGVMAGAAANGGFSTRAFAVGETCGEIEGSSLPPEGWRVSPPNGERDCGETLVAAPPRLQPRGIRAFISDLLFAADPEAVTAVLADQASAASVVQLLDAPDRLPPQRGTVRLVDSERARPTKSSSTRPSDADTNRGWKTTGASGRRPAPAGPAFRGSGRRNGPRRQRRTASGNGGASVAMMPTFASPLFFWGVVSLAGLGVIYLLRMRSRRTVVSSLLLWVDDRTADTGGRIWRRMRTPLLFFVELLALALLVLAATDPLWPRAGRLPVVVILDNSFSMQAVLEDPIGEGEAAHRSRRRPGATGPNPGSGEPSCSNHPRRKRADAAARSGRILLGALPCGFTLELLVTDGRHGGGDHAGEAGGRSRYTAARFDGSPAGRAD